MLILRNCLFDFKLRLFYRRTTQKSPMRLVGDTDKSKQKDGSRNSDGNVPNANWNDDKFKVNWNNPGNQNDNLRPREEVSHKKKSKQLLFVLLGNLTNYYFAWKFQ